MSTIPVRSSHAILAICYALLTVGILLLVRALYLIYPFSSLWLYIYISGCCIPRILWVSLNKLDGRTMFSLKIHYVLFYFALNTCGYMIRCKWNYNDVIMSTMASKITSLTIVYSTVYSRCRPKKTSKLRVTGLCEGNSPVTGEFPT